MRQMAMVGSGCSACHSFTGPCPHEAPPWAGCSQHQVTILLRALHSAPSKKLNLLPRPYDLACLPPQLHLPSATPSLPQSPWPPLLPHMKLPSLHLPNNHYTIILVEKIFSVYTMLVCGYFYSWTIYCDYFYLLDTFLFPWWWW